MNYWNGLYGSSEFGSGEYGSDPHFGVTRASALSPIIVRVRFNYLLDFTDPATLNLANYVLSPSVLIHEVIPETASSVLLSTVALGSGTYTVTVSNVKSAQGWALDPALRQATFNTTSTPVGFQATAISPIKVRLLFGSVMTADDAYTDPASYSVTDGDGVDIPVASVIREGSPDNPSMVALVLSAPFRPLAVNSVAVSDDVTTHDGTSIFPNVAQFQLAASEGNRTIPLGALSGEVRQGLLGRPAGLVFFSPSLDFAVPNSEIQVDFVRACTLAYDEYHVPQPPDPPVLFTHGSSLWATPQPSGLSTQAVLFGRFEKLTGVHVTLHQQEHDVALLPDDPAVSGLLREAWDLTRVALLNTLDLSPPTPRWGLFDAAGSVVPFITADNLSPIPVGASAHHVMLHAQVPLVEPPAASLASHHGSVEVSAAHGVTEDMAARFGPSPSDVEVVPIVEQLVVT